MVVSGAVQKPGKIVFERPAATVLEAIMETGGFTPEADLTHLAIVAWDTPSHPTRPLF